MKKILLVLFLIQLPCVLFAQKIRFEGVVKDQKGNALEMANVIAFKKEQIF